MSFVHNLDSFENNLESQFYREWSWYSLLSTSVVALKWTGVTHSCLISTWGIGLYIQYPVAEVAVPYKGLGSGTVKFPKVYILPLPQFALNGHPFKQVKIAW